MCMALPSATSGPSAPSVKVLAAHDRQALSGKPGLHGLLLSVAAEISRRDDSVSTVCAT